jgi:hypothetical protein
VERSKENSRQIELEGISLMKEWRGEGGKNGAKQLHEEAEEERRKEQSKQKMDYLQEKLSLEKVFSKGFNSPPMLLSTLSFIA